MSISEKCRDHVHIHKEMNVLQKKGSDFSDLAFSEGSFRVNQERNCICSK